MGEMSERLKGFFGLKPTIATTEGVRIPTQSGVEPFIPPARFEQAKVMDRPTAQPSGKPGSAESAGTPHKPHKGRKILAGGVAAATLGGGGYLGVNALRQSDQSPETTTPNTVVTEITTPPLSTPESTVITVSPETTPPTTPESTAQTTLAPTTTEAPTTTAEPQPTDVVERRDGYDVLRNGGLLYEVQTEPWLGGYELHLKNGQEIYGLNSEAGAEVVILNGILDAFGGQHAEFRNVDGTVNRDAYKAFLESKGGKDLVVIPENKSPEDQDISYPPVEPSSPLQLDLSKPIVFVGGDYSFYDAEFVNIQYYRHTPNSNAHAFIGITQEGQLYIGMVDRNQQGTIKNTFSPYDYSVALPTLLSITANISTISNPGNPQLNWQQPFWDTIMPFGTIPSNLYTPNLTVVNILDYGAFSTGESKIFAQQ